MSWFMRGVQSAIFHYVSCAPCTGYMYRKKRRKQAKRDRKAKRVLEMEQPDLYRHPEPSATNPYWSEEIILGPGPPPRRQGHRTTTGSQRGITTAGTHSTIVSQGGSSIDMNQSERDAMRMSDDTLDADNWNRKRYQREDEELWGFGDSVDLGQSPVAGSSVGVAGISRPGTAKSSSEGYYAPRAPPVNDLHPPIVSNPSPHAAANRWMLQPPPKASIMNGKERATRSRSGSGASSRVELTLQRQVSERQLKAKLERGETPEMPPLSRGSSYNNFHNAIQAQRYDRDPKAPIARPPSAASSRRKKRRDTAMTRTQEFDDSSGNSSDTIVHSPPRASPTPSSVSRQSSLKAVRVRASRQKLSTVISSGSLSPEEQMKHADTQLAPPAENEPTRSSSFKRRLNTSTTSTDSVPYAMKHRSPLTSSDISSLNILQDLVSPRALLNSRFVSAPLMEARIKLPPSDKEEETLLVGVDTGFGWSGSGFSMSRAWVNDEGDDVVKTKTGDYGEAFKRDPRMRWSVDF